jgi:hypothetical protein
VDVERNNGDAVLLSDIGGEIGRAVSYNGDAHLYSPLATTISGENWLFASPETYRLNSYRKMHWGALAFRLLYCNQVLVVRLSAVDHFNFDVLELG